MDLLTKYQEDVLRTEQDELKADNDLALLAGVLGLNGEAGEASEIIKKSIIQGKHELPKEELIEELGDALFYLAYTALKGGTSLEEVIKYNIEKRGARYPQGFDKGGSD